MQSVLVDCHVQCSQSQLAALHQGHMPAIQHSIESGNAYMRGNCSSEANAILLQKFVSADRTEHLLLSHGKHTPTNKACAQTDNGTAGC